MAEDLKQRMRDPCRQMLLSEREIIELLSNKIEQLEAELETEQMRLVACGVVAMANTPESAAKARDMLPKYQSTSCDDVARAVDREMALRTERDELFSKLDKMEGRSTLAEAQARRTEDRGTDGDIPLYRAMKEPE